MAYRHWLWLFATILIPLIPRPTTAVGLAGLFAEGVPGYRTEPGVTVASRLRPDADTTPIHAGGLLVTPRFEAAIGYDDNVLSGPTRRGSGLATSSGSLTIGSGWSRDAIGVFLSATNTQYFSQPAQDRTDGSAAAGGTLDFGRDKLTVAAAHVAGHEDRSDLTALASDRPVGYRLDDVRLSYTAAFDRLTIVPDVALSTWHYGDTTVLGQFARQAYRNRSMLNGGAAFRYEWAPLRRFVFVTRALTQHYASSQPGQPTLNSTGYQALLGVDYDDDSVWRLRLLVGGESRQFAAPQYRMHTAVVAEGELTWNPSGMTTIHATVTRTIEDAAQEGVSGFAYTAGKLSVDHELCRDVLFDASFGVRHAAFLQGGNQSGVGAGVGIVWLFNRHARLSATYTLNTVHGTGSLHAAAAGYARDVAMMTVRLGL